MKKNKLRETKTKEIAELKKELELAKKQLVKIKLEIVSGKVKNVRAAKNLKKDIAQLKTLLNEKKAAVLATVEGVKSL